MLNVGDRSVSQEPRRLKDRLSDDRNAQNLNRKMGDVGSKTNNLALENERDVGSKTT
jgi:hypothetical protein